MGREIFFEMSTAINSESRTSSTETAISIALSVVTVASTGDMTELSSSSTAVPSGSFATIE